MSVWTEERVAKAEKLWREGLSASQIAAAVRGVSRNAVLGMMNRERGRFPKRRDPHASNKPRAERPKAAKPAKPATPKVKKAAGGSTPNFKAEKRSARLVNLGVRVVQAPAASASAPFPHRGAALEGAAPGGVRFTDLTSRQCAWPLTDFTDADGPDMPCCGLPRRGGNQPDSPYCAGHAARSRGDL